MVDLCSRPIFFIYKIILNLGFDLRITFTLRFILHMNDFKERFRYPREKIINLTIYVFNDPATQAIRKTWLSNKTMIYSS